MGLDFSNNEAHWSYSGFNRFRERLGTEIGIQLREMNGFTRDDTPGISWDTVNDPIKFLLDHSDCDDALTPAECELIEPSLRKLVFAWEDSDYDKINALYLADGMRESVVSQTPLEFC
jgi:hypothetical protein